MENDNKFLNKMRAIGEIQEKLADYMLGDVLNFNDDTTREDALKSIAGVHGNANAQKDWEEKVDEVTKEVCEKYGLKPEDLDAQMPKR